MSLRGFLEEMEGEGKVVHVKDSISPRFEVASVMKAFDGGPILQFDDVPPSYDKSRIYPYWMKHV